MATGIIILGLLGVGVLATPNEDLKTYSLESIANTGILFEDIGGLLSYHSTWNVVMDLDLGEVQDQIGVAERAEHLVKMLCAGKSLGCAEQLRHVHSLVENLKIRSQALFESLMPKRTKRSFIDGVGRALHSLFGTMDDENEKELYSRLDNLEDKERELVKLEKQKISVVNISLEEIHKPLSDVINRQAELGLQIKDIFLMTDKLLAAERRNVVLTSLLAQLLEIETRQRTLIDIVVSVQNNIIHPLLISSKKLLEIYVKPANRCPEFCEQILAQATELQHFRWKTKLVVIITLPLLQIPLMKLYQIHLFPIRTNGTLLLIPDVEYSFVASDITTQQFLLLADNTRHKKIKHPQPGDLYVAPLTTPIVQSPPSTNEIISLLYNPLKLKTVLPLRVSTSVTDSLIKLSKPNSWIYFLQTETPIHIRCDTGITTHKMIGQGILTLHLPCTIQINEMTIHYEAESTHPFKTIQPQYFPEIDPRILEVDVADLGTNHSMPKMKLVTARNGGTQFAARTHSLNEIYSHLERIKFNESTRKHVHLSTASTSLAAVSLFIIGMYLSIRFIKGRCHTNASKRTPTEMSNPGIALQICTEEASQQASPIPLTTENSQNFVICKERFVTPPSPNTQIPTTLPLKQNPTRSFQLV